MWMIRWFFLAVVFIVAIIFITSNSDLDPIEIDFVFTKTEAMRPLTMLFLAYAFGFLTWFVISLFNFAKMKSELHGKEKLIKNLKDELTEYRNASLSIENGDETTIVIDSKDKKDEEEV